MSAYQLWLRVRIAGNSSRNGGERSSASVRSRPDPGGVQASTRTVPATATPAACSASRRRRAARSIGAGSLAGMLKAGSLIGYSPRSSSASAPHTGSRSRLPAPWRSRPTVSVRLITSMPSGARTRAGAPMEGPGATRTVMVASSTARPAGGAPWRYGRSPRERSSGCRRPGKRPAFTTRSPATRVTPRARTWPASAASGPAAPSSKNSPQVGSAPGSTTRSPSRVSPACSPPAVRRVRQRYSGPRRSRAAAAVTTFSTEAGTNRRPAFRSSITCSAPPSSSRAASQPRSAPPAAGCASAARGAAQASAARTIAASARNAAAGRAPACLTGAAPASAGLPAAARFPGCVPRRTPRARLTYPNRFASAEA